MIQRDLELMLREAGLLARERDFFLFGSQSIRAVCKRLPRSFPKTVEADLYPRRHAQAWAILRDQMGRGSKFYRQHGCFLDCVDPGLAMLPEGWTDRLLPFRTPRMRGVTAWCLEPHDLFVSKLVAWRDKDRQFLTAMLHHKLAKTVVVRERIEAVPISLERKEELRERLAELVVAAVTRFRRRPKRKRN